MATVTPFPSTPAAGWARTVHTIAAKARAAFPALGGKIDHATALVLSGAVIATAEPQRYLVASESDPAGVTSYDVHGGASPTCTCEDYTHRHEKETDFRCKHILAVWIYRRTLSQQERETTPVASTATLPEAAFSITLKGSMQGHEVLLTARGATWEEFTANVERLSGLLDAPAQTPAAPQPPAEGWCTIHQVQMTRQSNERGSWWSHKDGDGWCRGKKKKGA